MDYKCRLVNYHYPADNLALFRVRDRGEDIQQCGVGPALVNLENIEISSEAIMMMPLTAQSSHLETRGYVGAGAHYSRHKGGE